MDFNETVPILMNLIIKTESSAFAIVNGKRSLHYFREFNRLLVCYDIKKIILTIVFMFFIVNIRCVSYPSSCDILCTNNNNTND